ncbi:protein kinase domain-containing protein, partial [Longimicrobium sp.]|uniref:protein kinase domain-containing protein n=1 Tax=Longimicrobium sp. TaxID=2029185 RepID=UPI002F95BA7F
MIRLIEQVGIGGFGTVWRAQDQFGREVAAKVINEDMHDIANVRDHAFALAQVTHPAVVRFYSVEHAYHPDHPDETVECAVMELISGTTLEARLKGSPLLWHQVVRIGRDLCSGLQAIHTANINHGDLGTCNVMLRNRGRAQIIDLLYRGTLAALTPQQLGERFSTDVRGLSAILAEILAQSVFGARAAERFVREEAGHGSLWWTRAVFLRIVDEFRPLRAHGVVTFPSGYSYLPGAAYVGVYVLASGDSVAVGLDLGYPSITNFAEEVADSI